MLLEIFAEERWIGKIQFVGNLLYRHVGKTQSVLNGFHREKLYDGTRPAIHRFLPLPESRSFSSANRGLTNPFASLTMPMPHNATLQTVQVLSCQATVCVRNPI